MATVQLKQVRKSYGATEIIKGLDLTIDDRELIVFVGPSGCGKSTLLRLMAGLEEITSGDLLIDGQRVNDIAPAKRGLALVFQSGVAPVTNNTRLASNSMNFFFVLISFSFFHPFPEMI